MKTAPSKVYPKGVPKKKTNITVLSPDCRSDQTWSLTPPKKTRTTPSRKRKATTPSAKSKRDELNSDSDGAVEVAARSTPTTGHKPDLNWCSSGSEDEGPLTHSKYTDEEKNIMYNTAFEDP